ncbi:TetR/AcrR family transcriptional regulator [Plantibacter sp. YIM 135347]|uniref:TetR/AcrR family transcriptional regulator n=1 Tax=Plantibacter sp. YIM 135347 TaxID=3423919 RepID=UPI003D3438E4
MAERQKIDRPTIIEAARRLLESDGADALSMRRLANELDSKPMTLYHYVPSKSELLSLVLADVAASIEWSVPAGVPRERMIDIAMDMADRLAEIPWILPILRTATHIGLPALALTDRFLSAALEAGSSRLEAVSLWRSVWWLVSSELLFQASAPIRDAGDGLWHERLTSDELPEVPTVRELFDDWAALSAAYDLRAAVEAQVDGVLAGRRDLGTQQRTSAR